MPNIPQEFFENLRLMFGFGHINSQNQERIWLADFFIKNCMVQKATAGTPKLTPKMCINNSIKMMGKYGAKGSYIEGFIIPEIPLPIVHAWNSVEDEWVDHTIKKPEAYIYIGVKIPRTLLVLATLDDAWTFSCGVFQTLLLTRDFSLVELARDILNKKGMAHKIEQDISNQIDNV